MSLFSEFYLANFKWNRSLSAREWRATVQIVFASILKKGLLQKVDKSSYEQFFLSFRVDLPSEENWCAGSKYM